MAFGHGSPMRVGPWVGGPKGPEAHKIREKEREASKRQKTRERKRDSKFRTGGWSPRAKISKNC